MSRKVPGLDPGIGETAMTGGERQARRRTPSPLPSRAHCGQAGNPHAPPGRPSPAFAGAGSAGPRRWCDALAGLRELQTQYVIWLDALPDNLLDSTTADALQTICDIDLADLQAIEPPRGFGRELTQTS